MNVELLFQIAAVGIVVTVLSQLLMKTERSEYALLVTVAGLIAVLILVAGEVRGFFDEIRSIFEL